MYMKTFENLVENCYKYFSYKAQTSIQKLFRGERNFDQKFQCAF